MCFSWMLGISYLIRCSDCVALCLSYYDSQLSVRMSGTRFMIRRFTSLGCNTLHLVSSIYGACSRIAPIRTRADFLVVKHWLETKPCHCLGLGLISQ
ncbi:hypothetical protein M758_6G210800 [Ceratodon purpureus]|nr:hypothetical protein M758_6G210800 [Ceratodon purpureus]